MMENDEDAWDHAVLLSQTVFASAIMSIMSAIIPRVPEDEERWDIRRILFSWVCKNGDLVGSDAVPAPELAVYEGVPVALLPLVFGCDRSRTRDKSTQERHVYVPGLWLRKEFLRVFEMLRSAPRDALLDQMDFGDAGACFSAWCKPFCVAYMHYMCNPHVPFLKETLPKDLSVLYEGFLRKDEAQTKLFLKVKAMYFGLFEHSCTLERLAMEHCAHFTRSKKRLQLLVGPSEDSG